MDKKRISLELSADLAAKLKKLAKKQELSVNSFIRLIIISYINNDKSNKSKIEVAE